MRLGTRPASGLGRGKNVDISFSGLILSGGEVRDSVVVAHRERIDAPG